MMPLGVLLHRQIYNVLVQVFIMHNNNIWYNTTLWCVIHCVCCRCLQWAHNWKTPPVNIGNSLQHDHNHVAEHKREQNDRTNDLKCHVYPEYIYARIYLSCFKCLHFTLYKHLSHSWVATCSTNCCTEKGLSVHSIQVAPCSVSSCFIFSPYVADAPMTMVA